MRLTLRTLLAFMDEILEPADREELAKKVEASDFAHDLIHRTKDTMRRLRLSAPHVVGTGIGLDPNTVAEYLDNVLPPDSVADFERICLESDVHLAEVASCHHVLTMVLGEPAEVEPAARQRMYSVPAEAEQRKQVRVEPAHSIPALGPMLETIPPPVARGFHATSGLQAASAAPRVRRASADIPDYLRASAWNRCRIFLAGLAAVLLLAVTAFLVFGLRGWIGGQATCSKHDGTGARGYPIFGRCDAGVGFDPVVCKRRNVGHVTLRSRTNRRFADPAQLSERGDGGARRRPRC